MMKCKCDTTSTKCRNVFGHLSVHQGKYVIHLCNSGNMIGCIKDLYSKKCQQLTTIAATVDVGFNPKET